MTNRILKTDELKPGDLLVNHGGATMRWNHFYQVIKRKGCKVWLGAPITRHEGNQEGMEWIEARADNPPCIRHAKFTANGLQLAGRPGEKDYNGKSREWLCREYWGTLYRQEIGDKEMFYGD